MNTLELAMPVKGTSWYDLVADIDEITLEGWEEDPTLDKGRPFPIEKKTSIRSVISSKVKFLHPERSFSANEETIIDKATGKEREVLMVRRFA